VLILAAVVVTQLAVARAAAAIQESSADVTVTEIGRGTHLRLHRFEFAPGGKINQQTILEPMLVDVLGGAFVFYIPESEGDTITFYGPEEPVAVDSTNCDLPLQGNPQECTFDDQPSATTLQCNQTAGGFECGVLDTVGIMVQPGTTLVLPGPTECMVCKLDADAGELEVAVVEPPGGATWWNAVPQEGATPESTPSANSAPAIAGKATLMVDPCTGLLR
jgi:hypothetical protein